MVPYAQGLPGPCLTVFVLLQSAGFPHGIVDHVQELSALAHRWGVCLHVDACLGGFVLPFARHLGYPVRSGHTHSAPLPLLQQRSCQ